ncbi:hypothetical protein ACGFZK_03780 [Streptomyces sp. NPDC048257]|uniref:hypothetical protein n=1 Tax=Streptomyces sp. NPDC048257 TaxID=3365526 RepID=UPI00371F4CD2
MKADWSTFWPKVLDATGETVYMVLITLALSTVSGLAVGLALSATRKGGVLPNRIVHTVPGLLINIIRPVPFIIAIVALAPVTRGVVGTMIGTNAAIFPMTVVATFGVARIATPGTPERVHDLRHPTPLMTQPQFSAPFPWASSGSRGVQGQGSGGRRSL